VEHGDFDVATGNFRAVQRSRTFALLMGTDVEAAAAFSIRGYFA
jgi:hypothetical protein